MMNTPAKIKYLLDANVLIGFSLWKPIALNLNKDFWSKFRDALARGEWVLLDVVVKEIKYDRDLMKWCQEQDKKGLVKKISDNDKSRGVFYQQAVEGVDGDRGVIRQGHPDHLHPLLDGKQGLLKGVGGHRHDDPVKDLQSPLDQVQMAVGDGVE